LGLVKALGELGAIKVVDYACPATPWWPLWFLLKRIPNPPNASPPDVLIAAGHRTHWAALTLKRLHGAFTTVLMRPSLPLCCFDIVVAPVHDGLIGARVIATQGALNAMRPSIKCSDSTLLLVGGPSKHFIWSDADVLRQIARLAERHPELQVTNSRRTPEMLTVQLEAMFGSRFTPWQNCPPVWLADQLGRTEQVWVSEDSVSMIYESLSAGCRVGLLRLQRPERPSRLVRGIDALVAEQRVGRWSETGPLDRLPANPGLQEAARVASMLWQRFKQ